MGALFVDLFGIVARALLGFLAISVCLWQIRKLPEVVRGIFKGITCVIALGFFCILLVGP